MRSFRRSLDKKRYAANPSANIGRRNSPSARVPCAPSAAGRYGGAFGGHVAPSHERIAERVQRAQQAQAVAEAAAKMQAHFGHFAPASNARQARRDADAAAKIQNLFRNSIGKRANPSRERVTPNRRRAQYEPRAAAGDRRAHGGYQQAAQQQQNGQNLGHAPPRFVRVNAAPPPQPRAFAAPQRQQAPPPPRGNRCNAMPTPRGIYVAACPSSRLDQLAQPKHARARRIPYH